MLKYLVVISLLLLSLQLISQNGDKFNWLDVNGMEQPLLILNNPSENQKGLMHTLNNMNSNDCIPGEFPAPENLRSEPLFQGRLLKWDLVPGSIAYYMEGSEIGGEILVTQFFGLDLTERFISSLVLDPGKTYRWRLRVACRVQPDTVASPFSEWDYFTMPSDDPLPIDTVQVVNAVYPNPASDRITFYCPELEGLNPTAKIYDTSGILVEKIELKQGSNEIHLNDYEDGVYIIRTSGIKGINTLKFLKIY